MSIELVSTEFDGRRISVIVHRSASDKLTVESCTRLACFGPSLIPFKERERVSQKVQLKVSKAIPFFLSFSVEYVS